MYQTRLRGVAEVPKPSLSAGVQTAGSPGAPGAVAGAAPAGAAMIATTTTTAKTAAVATRAVRHDGVRGIPLLLPRRAASTTTLLAP